MKKDEIDQYLARLETRGQEFIESPAKAQDILEGAGIVDSDGNLTEHYRADDDGEKQERPKSFRETVKIIKNREGYWIEKTKIGFGSELHMAMKKKGLSKAKLATLLRERKEYVGNILSGESDFTVTEMARIAKALNCSLSISLDEQEAIEP